MACTTAAAATPARLRAFAPSRVGGARARRGPERAAPRRASLSRAVRASASADAAVSASASASAPPAPFAGFVAPEVRDEIIVKMPSPGDLDGIDEREWVPQTSSVSFRPLLLNVSQGYYVNLLRVKGAGVLSRHRHPGPVHGFVLKGSWRYLEHDWVAEQGTYVFEPPGETHTLVVDEGVEEMITFFNVTGSLLYCDEDGNVTHAEDVFDKLEMAKRHYEKVGLGASYVDKFVR
jgi:2,4'-dihydroxyacetophenone dioxygenase